MVGWHHRLNGRECEQAPGDGEGQGSLACCRPWGCKESDTTEQLNNNNCNGGARLRPEYRVMGVMAQGQVGAVDGKSLRETTRLRTVLA